MQYYEEAVLKDGRRCVLRHPERADAHAVLRHRIVTSGETENMLRYADEIVMTDEEEAEFLARTQADPRALMLSAEVEGSLVGSIGLQPLGSVEKLRHRGEVGLSVLRSHWGCGVGSLLMSRLIAQAPLAQYRQLELDVVEDNQRALALYQKFGFTVYGVNRKAFLCRDGRYQSLLMMCRDI